jgi:hypothetical protein
MVTIAIRNLEQANNRTSRAIKKPQRHICGSPRGQRQARSLQVNRKVPKIKPVSRAEHEES